MIDLAPTDRLIVETMKHIAALALWGEHEQEMRDRVAQAVGEERLARLMGATEPRVGSGGAATVAHTPSTQPRTPAVEAAESGDWNGPSKGEAMNIANAEVEIETNEFGVVVVTLGGESGDGRARVVLQCDPNADRDPMLVQHGMDTYHIEIDEPSRASYGGVERLVIDDVMGHRTLRFSFDALAAGRLGVHDLAVALAPTDRMFELTHYLRLMFREHARQVVELFVPAMAQVMESASGETPFKAMFDVVPDKGGFFVAIGPNAPGAEPGPLAFMQVYDVGALGVEAHRVNEVSIEWSPDARVAYLFIGGVYQAIYDFGQRAWYCRTTGLDAGTAGWAQNEDRHLTDAVFERLWVPRVNKRPRP
jgi:hypothetical protein